MDILDYEEATAERTLEVARRAYDMLHERVYKTAAALTAGAGATGGFALGKIGDPGAAIQWIPLSVLALYWFAVACFLILSGATSNRLSPGNGPEKLQAYYDHCLAEEVAAGVDKEARALRETRKAELGLKQGRLDVYLKASNRRARAMDCTFRMIAASPVLPILAALTVACLSRAT